MARRLPPLLLLVSVFVLPPAFAQNEPGPVEAAQRKLAAAKAALEQVRSEMQARYVEIEADFKLVHSRDFQAISGPFLDAIRDVEARRREKPDTDPGPILTAAFRKPALLSETVADRLAAAAAAALPEASGEAKAPETVLAAAVAAVFPEKRFSDCWDKAFQDLPVVEGWRQANQAVARAEAAEKAAEKAAEAEQGPKRPAGMVLVPKGRFEFGPWTGWQFDLKANKEQKERCEAFYIDVDEVTNEQYLRFLNKRGKKAAEEGWLPTGFTRSDDGKYSMPEGEGNRPVRGVSFAAATAYAEFVGKRLPTEEEWEYAARGRDGRLYPWGKEWDPAAANSSEKKLDRPMDVGTNPGDKSPFGVMDMAGNVSEYTAVLAGRKPARGSLKATDAIVTRGGNYHEGKDACQTTYRWTTPATGNGEEWIGFRCVLSEKDFR